MSESTLMGILIPVSWLIQVGSITGGAFLLWKYDLRGRAHAITPGALSFGVGNGWRILRKAVLVLSWILWCCVGALLVSLWGPYFLADSPADLLGFYIKLPPQQVLALVSVALVSWVLLLAVLSTRCAKWILPLLRLDPQRMVHRVFVAIFINDLFLYVCRQIVTSDAQESPSVVPDESYFLLSYLLSKSLYVVLALAGVGYLVKRNWSETVSRLGLHRAPSWQAAGMVLLFTVVDLALHTGFFALLQDIGWVNSSHDMAASSSVGMILLYSIIPGFVEELLFRGVVQPRIGMILTSFWFALQHPYGWAGFITVFLGGLLYGWLARRYGLWASMASHALFNAIMMSTPFE